ncbi:MAG: glycosyltransferase family 4 protein [Bacteroidales bacterium]|nr:glycosyltransferase family 4 protein [Bacteroidales bacterium]
MIDKKLKICFVLSHLPQGGAERQTINLIRGLEPSLYDITLLIYDNKDIFYEEVFTLPIHLKVRPAYKGNKLVRNLGNALFLRETLRELKFDIIHTLLFHNGFWVRLVAPRMYTGKIVYSVRNSLEKISGFEKLFEKILVSRSHVVTNSSKVKDQYLRIVGSRHISRITNIYNGIEIERFRSEEPPPLSEKIIIGTVGRQTIIKNQIQILQAINNISRQYKFHFYLIGDKTQDSSVDNETFVKERKLNDFVTILDSQSEIESYYKMFNIFILSSIAESCPNVLFEAMLSKCICIISAGSNTDNYVQHGINGLVYDGTLRDLERKLIHAIEIIGQALHGQMVENGYKYASENFSVERMVSDYERLYLQICNKLEF